METLPYLEYEISKVLIKVRLPIIVDLIQDFVQGLNSLASAGAGAVVTEIGAAMGSVVPGL